ncbi:hypothetical protein [Agrobacterium cavarae]|uniref:hypothetical protein n=1 Tax=Agrobacterium cavarae TaxID=2528239 RepID=UPI002FFBD9B2
MAASIFGMRKDIFDSLTDQNRFLVSEIERSAGFEIEVITISERHEKYGLPYVPEFDDFPGVRSNHKFIRLELPDEFEMTPDIWLHELLHLDRFYVQRVPKLIGRGPQQFFHFINGLDNSIEHVFFFEKGARISNSFAASERFLDQNFWNTWQPPAGNDIGIFPTTLNAYSKASRHYPEMVEAIEDTIAPHLDMRDFKTAAEVLSKINDKAEYARYLLAPFPVEFKRSLFLCDTATDSYKSL